MRAAIGLVLALALSPASSFAQTTCGGCLLGVYDDLSMTRTSGRASSFQVKTVYLGLKLAPGVSIVDLAFTASYPRGFSVVDVQSLVPGGHYDIVGNTARVHWTPCAAGTHALFRVKVLTPSAPRNALLQLNSVTARICGGPSSPTMEMPAGCYILNPSGTTPPCLTGTETATWSFVKRLFTTADSR